VRAYPHGDHRTLAQATELASSTIRDPGGGIRLSVLPWFVHSSLLPLLHSRRVAPGLSLNGRSALVARSVAETPQARRTGASGDVRERDQTAWNLPRPPEEAIPRGAHKDGRDAGERDRREQGVAPPATALERGA
jgi:hypothetical protein